MASWFLRGTVSYRALGRELKGTTINVANITFVTGPSKVAMSPVVNWLLLLKIRHRVFITGFKRLIQMCSNVRTKFVGSPMANLIKLFS